MNLDVAKIFNPGLKYSLKILSRKTPLVLVSHSSNALTTMNTLEKQPTAVRK
jgi:hypothetical protein